MSRRSFSRAFIGPFTRHEAAGDRDDRKSAITIGGARLWKLGTFASAVSDDASHEDPTDYFRLKFALSLRMIFASAFRPLFVENARSSGFQPRKKPVQSIRLRGSIFPETCNHAAILSSTSNLPTSLSAARSPLAKGLAPPYPARPPAPPVNRRRKCRADREPAAERPDFSCAAPISAGYPTSMPPV